MEETQVQQKLTNSLVEDDAQAYLNKHRIIELLNNLTAQVVFNRPTSPRDYMIEQLLQLKKARTMKQNYPCIFDDGNIQSIFSMMDPTNRGFITVEQFNEAMKTLGVKDYQKKFATDQITFDIFLREAKLGLVKASATVQST